MSKIGVSDIPKIAKKYFNDDVHEFLVAIGMLLEEYDIKTAKDIKDIYGFEVSDGMFSDITDRFLPQIEDWQKRLVDEVYPIIFIDAAQLVQSPGRAGDHVPDRIG